MTNAALDRSNAAAADDGEMASWKATEEEEGTTHKNKIGEEEGSEGSLLGGRCPRGRRTRDAALAVFVGDEGVEAAEVGGRDGLELGDLDDDEAEVVGDALAAVGELGVDGVEELRDLGGDGLEDVGEDFLELLRRQQLRQHGVHGLDVADHVGGEGAALCLLRRVRREALVPVVRGQRPRRDLQALADDGHELAEDAVVVVEVVALDVVEIRQGRRRVLLAVLLGLTVVVVRVVRVVDVGGRQSRAEVRRQRDDEAEALGGQAQVARGDGAEPGRG
eukprot:CAMPEP_0198665722 /NCGR_PEP_ID=MMETSP1467-20131203/61771_1 /TAXON_ID=1462469 /ORGANISM="unid. sp., Strain CCMP2135" /LENGTH=276 /DNA_ID=CAMNT_0044402327 /DNA_START=86 /DNA_END=912 /DNA_ORIENTATION=+